MKSKSLLEKIETLEKQNKMLLEKSQHLNVELVNLKKAHEDEKKELNDKIKARDLKIE